MMLSGLKTMRIAIFGLLLAMPMLSAISSANFSYGASNSSVDLTRFQLSVIPMAPKLPADGQTYFVTIQLQTLSNGKPIEAPNDMEISVISSDPSVLQLSASAVVLKSGESLAKSNVSTTTKGGVVSISALSQGIKSGSASVITVTPDSLNPTTLALYSAPSSLIPGASNPGLLYVQLLNARNIPAVSSQSVVVSLSSSDSKVATVPAYATVPAGASGIMVDFTPGMKVGSTTVRAVASGLALGEKIVNTAGLVASDLVVEFAPPIIPAEPGLSTMMTIQLRDTNNFPVRASQDIVITLKSSDSSVADVPSSLTIPAGHTYVSKVIDSEGGFGITTISALTTGYGTGFGTLQSANVTQLGASDVRELQIYSAPSVLPPDSSEHDAIVVAFYDENGLPYKQYSSTIKQVVISNSDSEMGEITTGVLTSETTFGIASFTTTFAIGETTISASGQGLIPAQMTLEVEGSAPTAISLAQIPGIVQANNKDSASLVVNLIDNQGYLVPAPYDVSIFMSSSDPEIATVPSQVSIPAGDSFVITNVHTKNKAGKTTIAGSSQNLATGLVEYQVSGFSGSTSEYALAIYTIPTLSTDERTHDSITLQLQDGNGLPVKAKSDILVTLSVSSYLGGFVQPSALISAGSSYTIATFRPSTTADREFKVTASSPGFQTVEATMGTGAQPLTVTINNDLPTSADFGNTIPVSVDVTTAGIIPVKDAIVKISGENAKESIVTTDQNGYAEGYIVPAMPGRNTFEITASKPGYEDSSTKAVITIDQAINISVGAQTKAGKGIVAAIKVNGPSKPASDTVQPGTPITLKQAKWGLYKLEAQKLISTPNAIYTFSSWSDGTPENPKSVSLIDDTTILAVYTAQYLVQVTSERGSTTGSGYYPEGTKTTISISKPSAGSILIDKTFAGWVGDFKSTADTADIIVDGPKIIKADWKDNYLNVFVFAAVGAGGAAGYYLKYIKPKKKEKAKNKPPSLDWYKR